MRKLIQSLLLYSVYDLCFIVALISVSLHAVVSPLKVHHCLTILD